MKVSSSFSPKSVEVIREEKRNIIIALRKNIVEIPEVDFFTGRELVRFEYDEVKLNVKNRQNIVQSIEANFENWFSKGLKLEQLGNEIKQKQAEMKQLTDEFKQIEVNNDLVNASNVSFDAVAELYMENINLKNENLSTMEAVATLYETIMMGGM